METFASVVIKGEEGLSSIASAHSLGGGVSAVSVVFARNTRPSAATLRALSISTGQFAISLDPGAESPEDTGWVELLANGLTFDCTGIEPGPPSNLPERVHNFGISADADFSSGETITLIPGPHLTGGAVMFPVVRCLAWLGALLADLPGVQAIVWHGARSYNAPNHFREGVLRWIEGGAFPGLGLTALARTADGGLMSEGLALFTGQEVTLAPDLASDSAQGAKLALRLIHWLVENGRIDTDSHLAGPSGETLLLRPVNNQRIIKVSKSL